MGFVVKAIKSVVKTVVGVVSKVAGGVFGFLVGGKSKKKAKNVTNLNKSLDPEAFRKIIFGKMISPLDVRFWEVWGTNGTRYDEVLAVATHRINGYKELYFETDLAIDAAGTVQAKYAGILTRDTRNGAPGQTAMSVGSGTQWTSAATFDGCAHMKLAWVPDEKRLPNGIPSRYTQVVEGAYVYDPRRDSTVPGGSGSHRINDQTTWSYATLDGNGQPIGRNNALQALWYLIGWRITNPLTGELVLVAGRGVDPQDINLATFIAGANNCEIAGYYTDMVLSTEDSHTSNEDKITCDGLIGRLIDPGGLWSYYANVDDTADIAVDLTDADIIQGVNVTWNEYKGMSDQYNQVRGKFIYPAYPVLYQDFPYPMVRDATYETNLGKKVAKPKDFEQVLDSTLAQRLGRLLLNEGQYQGEFSAGFNYRALRAQAWSVVRYTSERYGWTKLFRVWRHDLTTSNGVSMLLKEIHPSIWSAGSVTAPLAPGTGAFYNANQQISATGVNVALVPMVGANGDKADGFRVYWNAPPENVRRTEIRFRLVGTTFWSTLGPVERDVTEVLSEALLSGAIYEVAVRHISIHEIPGNWITPTTAPANGSGQFQLGTTGTVNYAAIVAAGGTATWSGVTNRPPLLTGESVTVDEFLKDPTVWTSGGLTFYSDPAGEGYVQTEAGVFGQMVHLSNNSIPIDHNATYEASFELAELGAGAPVARFYTIIVAYDANNNIIAGDGSYWFYPTSYYPLTYRNVWEVHSATFGKGTNKVFPSNAVKFGLGILMNYDVLPGSGVTRARRFKCRRVAAVEMTAALPFRQTVGNGKAIRNSGSIGWGISTAYTRASISGPQTFSFRFSGPQAKMAGLSEITPGIYSDASLSIYFTDTAGLMEVWSGAGQVAVFPGISTREQDEFSIDYDGLYLRPMRNGIAMGTYKKFVGPNKTFKGYVDSYYLNQGIIELAHTAKQSVAVINNSTFNPNGTPWLGQNYATSSDNKIFNADLADNAKGWQIISGAVLINGSGSPIPNYWYFAPSITSQVSANDGSLIPIEGAKNLYVSGMSYVNSGGISYFRLEAFYYKTDGSPSAITVSQTVDLNQPTTGVWLPFNGVLTPPIDAVSVYIKLVAVGNAAGSYVGGLRLAATEPAATRNTFRGDYAPGTAYDPGDVVNWTVASGGDGKGYGRIGSGSTTGIAPSDATKWKVIVERGGTGAPGATGAAGLTISASPPAWPVACTFNGTPKSAVQGFQITVYQGGTNVTSLATYGTPTVVGLSGVVVSGSGVVTTTGMTADTGYILVPVSYGGATANIRVDYTKVKDGNAAVSGSVAVASLNNTGTYVSSANFNVSLANGQTFNVNANVSYGVVSATYGPQVKLAYVNTTDGGAETDISGSEVTGPTVVTPGDIENVSTSGSFTNSSGGTKTFNIRLLTRRAVGAGNSTSVTGSLGGNG